jgi:hypothetical protein
LKPNSRIQSFIDRWSYSLILGASYLAIFNFWKLVERTGTIVSGLLACALLTWRFSTSVRRGYFTNGWDALLHVMVILDILLEATLIPAHQTIGFYWCALAFAVVIGGYRLWQLRKLRPAITTKETSLAD